MYSVEIDFKWGFLLLIAAVICEKLLQQFVLLQFATMISERTGLEELRREATIQRKLSLCSRRQRLRHMPRPILTTAMISNHMNMLSPAARYVTASQSQDTLYAGQPRIIWSIFANLGILQQVEEFGLSSGANI